MSHELFYTSAPQGLKPGSQGFCTVARTRGLPDAVAERLEALSAYRPAFSPRDGRAALDLVVLAHYRLSHGGRPLQVLSRVSAAGLDYSQRHNKFAHHVALDADELPAGGPAWLLQQPGFMAASWDGEVRVLPSGRTPPRGEAPAAPCRNWQRVTGDAGWAGVLAAAFLDDPSRVAYLLYEPGLDPLPLLAEAANLLPAEQRWDATFSTYYTGLPQGVRCGWRCVLAGSPEAAEADRLPGALVIDLAAPLGPAPDGELTRQARTGERRPLTRGRAPTARPLAPADPPPRRSNVAAGVTVREIPFEEVPDEPAGGEAATPPRTAVPPPPPVNPPRPPRGGARRRDRLLTGFVLGLLAALPLAGAGFAGGLLLPREQAAATAPGDPPAEETVGAKILQDLKRINGKAAEAKDPQEAEKCAAEVATLLRKSPWNLGDLAAVLERQRRPRDEPAKEVAELRDAKVRELEARIATLNLDVARLYTERDRCKENAAQIGDAAWNPQPAPADFKVNFRPAERLLESQNDLLLALADLWDPAPSSGQPRELSDLSKDLLKVFPLLKPGHAKFGEAEGQIGGLETRAKNITKKIKEGKKQPVAPVKNDKPVPNALREAGSLVKAAEDRDKAKDSPEITKQWLDKVNDTKVDLEDWIEKHSNDPHLGTAQDLLTRAKKLLKELGRE